MLDAMAKLHSVGDYIGNSAQNDVPTEDVTPSKDGAIYIATHQIAENYMHLIRTHVMPSLTLNRGLKLREMRVLGCIFRYKISMQASDVAKVLSEDPSTISRAVRKLDKEGLIVKLSSRDDARARILVLSETGIALAQEYNKKTYKICKHLSRLSKYQVSDEDVREFLRLSERIKNYSHELASFRPGLTRNLFSESLGK